MAAPNITNRVRFVKGRIDSFHCPPDRKDAYLWDTEVPGLGIRAHSGGSRQYVFQGRLNGKALRVTIGPVDAWGIDDARQQARGLRILVDRGVHPGDEKKDRLSKAEKARRERERQTFTVADAWAGYIEERRGRWSELHIRDHHKAMQAPGEKRQRSAKKTAAGPLWALRDIRLADLNSELLECWIESESKARPAVAARSFRLFRAFVHWCHESKAYCGLIDPQVLFTKRIRERVPKPQAKRDVLQKEQLQAWFQAVRKGNPVVSAYLQGLLITGARREELARITWKDVDFKWKSLAIRDKVEGERVIPLTPYLSAILASLPRVNQWVFSSSLSKSGRLRDVWRAHVRVLDAAGLPHVSLHGLRRSFGTLSEWIEVPAGIVAQIMGHKPSALAEKHYRKRPLDLLRKWHVQIEAWMLDQAGIPQPDERTAAIVVIPGGRHD